jgi:hypothetical protein
MLSQTQRDLLYANLRTNGMKRPAASVLCFYNAICLTSATILLLGSGLVNSYDQQLLIA